MYKDLSIYIHIPFCVKKCNYCDFISAVPKEKQLKSYADALCKEIKLSAGYADNFNIKTVFIGGGTPSIYDSSVILCILDVLKNTFENRRRGSYIPDEVTIECNPGTLNSTKLSDYRKAGINRLSIGLQSANEDELKLLGRIHTADDWEQSMKIARKCGFNNINTDIISGLPGQSVELFAVTLDKVLEYSPEHISVYSLIIEKGTPFYDLYNHEKLSDEELDKWDEADRDIYEYTYKRLSEYGYNRYEISNYAKKGCESRHNMVYWNRGNYLGFGIASASLINNIRFANTDSFSEYIAAPYGSVKTKETLTVNDCMSEFAFLALRTSYGISRRKFYDEFGKDIYDIYGGIIKKWTDCGMLEEKDGRIFCTERGINVSNVVMADFII